MDAMAIVLDLQQLVATLLDNDVDLSGSCTCAALLKNTRASLSGHLYLVHPQRGSVSYQHPSCSQRAP